MCGLWLTHSQARRSPAAGRSRTVRIAPRTVCFTAQKNIDHIVTSKESPPWNQTIGVPEWVHQGSVANTIKSSPGTMGYAELDYALTKGIPFALVKNPTGNFIAPSN